MASTSKPSKKQSSAPEWHFADEEAATTGAGVVSSVALAASNNKFIIRGALLILLLIAAMYTFDFKEIRALNSSQEPDTWFASKPHWQSTEEMKMRVAKQHGHHPDVFPGQEAGDDNWLNDIDVDEWMDRVDAEMAEELQNQELGQGYYIEYN